MGVSINKLFENDGIIHEVAAFYAPHSTELQKGKQMLYWMVNSMLITLGLPNSFGKKLYLLHPPFLIEFFIRSTRKVLLNFGKEGTLA